jgi:hypothetical protein
MPGRQIPMNKLGITGQIAGASNQLHRPRLLQNAAKRENPLGASRRLTFQPVFVPICRASCEEAVISRGVFLAG